MPHEVFDPTHPAGFIVREPAKIERKLREFASSGPKQLYYLFDFDGTLTTSKYTGTDITTWQLLHGLLPEEGQRKSTAIRSKYLAMEAAGSLSVKDTRKWSAAVLKLHGAHGTSLHELTEAARHIKLREGTRRLFDACQGANIPTVILSAGVRDVIEVIIAEHRINPTVILSLKLAVSEDGKVIGWERGSMIHTLNKREKGNRVLARLRAERPYTVLIGDTIADARMVDGDDRVLRIRVCDVFKEDQNNPVNYLQQSFDAGYDMVIEGSLQPLVDLTKWLSLGDSGNVV